MNTLGTGRRVTFGATLAIMVVPMGSVARGEQAQYLARGQQMYWTDCGGTCIRRANLDGSAIEDIINPTSLEWVYEIAIDPVAEKMYWSGVDFDAEVSKIRRANLDGSGVHDVIVSTDSIVDGIALDVAAGKMYWALTKGGGRTSRFVARTSTGQPSRT